mgnify:CR=1 FL=1
MENNNYTLTAIVPFFNEEQTIMESVKNLEKITLINAVILVDDCSSDSSPEKAKVLANTLDKVTYLRLKKNKGKGGAVLSAINSVVSSHVVIHDADLEYNPNDIVKMFNSLKKIKELPEETEIYCGHEYTLQNSNFCISQDPDNIRLKEKILEIKKKLADNLPSIPSLLGDELKCNIFLKAKDLKSFSKLRDLKDNF